MRFEDDRIPCPSCNKDEGRTINILELGIVDKHTIVEKVKCKCIICDHVYETVIEISCEGMNTDILRKMF